MKIVITHGHSDSNKGDLSIAMGTVLGIRKVVPNASIVLQSVFSELDPDFKFHSRFIAETEVRVMEGILPSPYIDDKKGGLWRDALALARLAKSALGLTLLRILPSIFSPLCPRQACAFQMMKEADVVIAKGGQYIFNDQGGMRGALYLWRILKIISTANQCGKPTILLGHSIGPLIGSHAYAAVRKVLRACRAIVVREELSLKLLNDLNIYENIIVAPDIAFLIEPVKPKNAKLCLTDGQWLGVTVINWSFPGSNNLAKQREKYMQVLLDTLIAAYRNYSLKPIIFPQVTSRHHGESDIDMIENLYIKLKSFSIPAKCVMEDLSPAELSFLYGQCTLLLGTRLHSCILAACAGTPSIAIRYQGYKTEGVMASIGLSKYVHNINNIEQKDLINSIANIISQREKLSRQILDYVTRDREQIIATINHILNISQEG
jgi:polysaccharide pyruvyl transferase WcaK-like protein